MNRAVSATVTGVVVIAALAAGRAITDAMPTDLSSQRGSAEPFVVDGTMGRETDLRYASIIIKDVRAARSIKGIVGPQTGYGTFLLVDMTIRARSEPVTLTSFMLRTPDGRHYTADSRWGIGVIPTGFVWHHTSVFEVPDDAMQGAVIEIAKGPDWWGQRRDDKLSVDLDIGKTEATEFAATRDFVQAPTDRFNPPETTPLGQVPDA